jgi:hypothetical protein
VEERALEIFLPRFPQAVLHRALAIKPLAQLYSQDIWLELCIWCQIEMSFDDILRQALDAGTVSALKNVMSGTLFRVTP